MWKFDQFPQKFRRKWPKMAKIQEKMPEIKKQRHHCLPKVEKSQCAHKWHWMQLKVTRKVTNLSWLPLLCHLRSVLFFSELTAHKSAWLMMPCIGMPCHVSWHDEKQSMWCHVMSCDDKTQCHHMMSCHNIPHCVACHAENQSSVTLQKCNNTACNVTKSIWHDTRHCMFVSTCMSAYNSASKYMVIYVSPYLVYVCICTSIYIYIDI